MRGSTAKLALIALAVAFAATHIVAIYSESINWDEFALLQRAERTIVTNVVQGGGRPGLATLALVPFVHDCTSSMDTMHAARLAWSFVTFAMLGGLFVFLWRANRGRAQAWQAAALGIALLALVPEFVKWSLHVRSDQPALAAVIWGGVALFASSRRLAWSVAAGALFTVGYLFSEKAYYALALVVPVVAGELFVQGKLERRDFLRAGGALAGAAVMLVAYRAIIPMVYNAPPPVSVDGGLSLFAFYRAALGYRVYWGMLPVLALHVVALLAIVFAVVCARRQRDVQFRSLLVAIGVAVIGLAVGKFHAAAFPYFWMTLGAFFAVAIGLGWPSLSELFPRASKWFGVVLWIWLVVHGARAAVRTFFDSQRIQRETLGFIESFPPAIRSYDTHGALFCRADPDPIPGAMVSSLIARFQGKHAPRAIEDFLREHRERPIGVVLVPNRTGNYPAAINEFWREHYPLYYGSVRVAGARFERARGTKRSFEVIVPGRYRWWAKDGQGTITVDGHPVASTVELARGMHEAEVTSDDGMLVLDARQPPWLGTIPFYTTAEDQHWHEERARTRGLPVFKSPRAAAQ